MNESDAAAKAHDLAYSNYLSRNQNPYLYYNQADEEFIRNTDQATDWGGRLGNLVFRAKRAIAPSLAERPEAPPAKKTRTAPPKHIFINQARKRKANQQGESSKRPKMADSGESSENAQQPAAAAETRAGGASAGSGGGGGGGKGGGVGHSTGSYDNRTNWEFTGDGYVIITCYSSRLVHTSMPLEEFYRTVPVATTGPSGEQNGYGWQDDAHVQVITPWKLLDPNAWGVWFSPGDFQYLINTCETLQALSLEQEIFNIVLKTVTETGPADAKVKVYNNDLTASLLLAEDSNNALPYTPAAIRGETIGFYPWQPTVPCNYRYYSSWERGLMAEPISGSGGTSRETAPREAIRAIEHDPEHEKTETENMMMFALGPDHNVESQSIRLPIQPSDQNRKRKRDPESRPPERQVIPRASNKWFTQNTETPQFFTVENAIPITMLRTGDSWYSGKYIFDTKTMSLSKQMQTMRQMGMPPLIVPPTTSTGEGTIARNLGKRTGLGWGHKCNMSEVTVMRPTTTGYIAPEWMILNTPSGPSVANGPIGYRDTQNAPNWDNGVFCSTYDASHGGQIPTNVDAPGWWDMVSLQQGGTSFKRYNYVMMQLTDNNGIPGSKFIGEKSQTQMQPVGKAFPYMGCSYSPYTSYAEPEQHYPWGMIWDKKPHMEHQAEFQPTAAFITDNPPGQILLKVAPNLTDNYNPNGSAFSRIITYADFWWKGKLTFKAKLRTPHQYNLTNYWNLPTQTNMRASMYYPDRLGQIELPHIRTKHHIKKVY